MSSHGFPGAGGDQPREEKVIALPSWQPQLANQHVMLAPNFLVSMFIIYHCFVLVCYLITGCHYFYDTVTKVCLHNKVLQQVRKINLM